MSEITKICTKCKVEQPLSGFYKDLKGKDGHSASCKDCNKVHRTANKTRILQYAKSRGLAIKNKDKVFKKEKTCPRCSITKPIESFSKDNRKVDGHRSHCRDCTKAYKLANRDKILAQAKAYHAEHKIEKVAYSKEYRAKNKEKIQAYNKTYRAENRYVRKESLKKWRGSNKPKVVAARERGYNKRIEYYRLRARAYFQTPIGKSVMRNSRHKRRAITKQGDVTTKQLLHLTQSATNCFWCNTPLIKVKIHIDHLYPLSKGGTHTISNLVVACAKCNMSKGSKDPIEFALKILSQNIVL